MDAEEFGPPASRERRVPSSSAPFRGKRGSRRAGAAVPGAVRLTRGAKTRGPGTPSVGHRPAGLRLRAGVATEAATPARTAAGAGDRRGGPCARRGSTWGDPNRRFRAARIVLDMLDATRQPDLFIGKISSLRKASTSRLWSRQKDEPAKRSTWPSLIATPPC
jgi:hypothetical protein